MLVDQLFIAIIPGSALRAHFVARVILSEMAMKAANAERAAVSHVHHANESPRGHSLQGLDVLEDLLRGFVLASRNVLENSSFAIRSLVS